jgi:hypothetical protein
MPDLLIDFQSNRATAAVAHLHSFAASQLNTSGFDHDTIDNQTVFRRGAHIAFARLPCVTNSEDSNVAVANANYFQTGTI